MPEEEIPIACALTTDELPGRIASARGLGARALVGVEAGERRALLRFDRGHESIDAFVAAESRCCSFLTFDVTQQAERVEVEILTPEGGEPVLRGLVAGVVSGWEGGLG